MGFHRRVFPDPDRVEKIARFGPLDTTPYAPVIDHPAFQLMRHKSQLGLVKYVFSGATHSRFEHSLASVLALTKIIEAIKKTRSKAARNFLDDYIATNLVIATLGHDLGHPPYSHILDYLLGKHDGEGNLIYSHNERTIELFGNDSTIRDAISRVENGDPRFVLELLSGHRYFQLIKDKNLGAEKLAYTELDHHHSGYGLSPPELGELLSFMLYKEGKFGVYSAGEPQLFARQEFYLRMWTEVYLSEKGVGVERLFQKAVEPVLDAGEIEKDEVWAMRESTLETKLAESQQPLTQRIMERIFSGDFLKTAIEYKLNGFRDKARGERLGEDVEVYGIEETFSNSFQQKFLSKYIDPRELTKLEDKLCRELGLDPSELVVAFLPEPEKIRPKDVYLFDSNGNCTGTFFSTYPSYQNRLLETANSFFAIRVMVPADKREQVSKKGGVINEIIKGDVYNNAA